jgi:hypothetical protein
MTEPTCVVVSALTCGALNAVTDKAVNWVVESEEMLFVETAVTWAVPKPLNCDVLKPETCAEVIALICEPLSEAKPLVVMEPIWVLVRAPMSLGESAATSPVLMDDRVVVLNCAAWPVVSAPMACVVRAVTCELLRAANAAVLMLTTSAAEMDGICPVVSACA